MAFTQRKSVHGRELGISATGGIVSAVGSTGGGSSIHGMAAQMWGDAMVQTVSSGGASVFNSGVTVVSTDSTSGMAALILQVPVAGIQKEIIFNCTATALTLDTNATTVFFQSSGSTLGARTTELTLTGATGATTGVQGNTLILRGVSATLWQVMSISADISS